jgi:hypothetical protein
MEVPGKNTLKFKIIQSDDPSQFEEEINALLQQGWVFNGMTETYPQSFRKDGSICEILYIQALQK